MAAHSSILARRISWTEEPGGLPVRGVAKSQARLTEHYAQGEESGKDALGPRNQIFPLAGRPWAPSSVYSDFSYHLLVTGFVLIAQLMVRGVHMMT